MRIAVDLDNQPRTMRSEVGNVARTERHLTPEMPSVERLCLENLPDRTLRRRLRRTKQLRSRLQRTISHRFMLSSSRRAAQPPPRPSPLYVRFAQVGGGSRKADIIAAEYVSIFLAVLSESRRPR